MNILLLDTSTENCYIFILSNDKYCSIDVKACFQHTEHSLLLLDSALKSLHLEITDIDLVITGIGPGSFTGVRIAHSLIKGLAFGSKTYILPLPTPSIFALSYTLNNISKCNIYVLIFGKKNRFYFSKYPENWAASDSFLKYLLNPEIYDLTLFEIIKKNLYSMNNDDIFIVDNREAFFMELSKLNDNAENPFRTELSEFSSKVNVKEVTLNFKNLTKIIADCVKENDEIKKYFIDAEELLPLYIRSPDALENL